METTIVGGIEVPTFMGETESQKRWLTQTSFTGAESEITLPVDVFDTFCHYGKPVVYRTTKQRLQDFIGRRFVQDPKFAALLCRFTTLNQQRKIQRWSDIVGALGTKKLVWRPW